MVICCEGDLRVPIGELLCLGPAEHTRGVRYDCFALVPARDDGDRRICRHLILEGMHVVHDQSQVHAEAAGHEPAEPATVWVAHPAVSADEAESPSGAEALQGGFVEADVDVCSAAHRRAGPAVGGHPVVRDIFESDIRRVADHVVGSLIILGLEQVVASAHPRRGYLPGFLRTPAVAHDCFSTTVRLCLTLRSSRSSARTAVAASSKGRSCVRHEALIRDAMAHRKAPVPQAGSTSCTSQRSLSAVYPTRSRMRSTTQRRVKTSPCSTASVGTVGRTRRLVLGSTGVATSRLY